jgi:hypothetical protein
MLVGSAIFAVLAAQPGKSSVSNVHAIIFTGILAVSSISFSRQSNKSVANLRKIFLTRVGRMTLICRRSVLKAVSV